MKPQITEVLAEANLTEAQVDQITGLVGDSLAAVRTAHIEEVTAIEKSKDAVIGGLMRDLVESKRLLAEATPQPSVVVLGTGLVLRDGALTANVVDGQLVFESKGEDGVVRRAELVLDNSNDLMETVLTLSDSLDEKVVSKPRRVVASNGTSAVGIDLDTTGTLAFTVTDDEGSSMYELSRPDSNAVREWFSLLQEAMDAKDTPPPFTKKKKEDDEDELEERVRNKVVAEVNKMLVEALRPYTPLVRQAKAHAKMKSLVESLEMAFGKVMTEAAAPVIAPEQLQESATLKSQTEALDEKNQALTAEIVSLRQSMLFTERTSGLAQTTKERIGMIVEAARPANLQDYSDLLEVAIQSVKPVAEVPAPAAVEKGGSKEPSMMQSVIDKL